MIKKKGLLFIIIVISIIVLAIFIPVSIYLLSNDDEPIEVLVSTTNDFNSKIIKEVNKNEKDNYLISPYSIEIALNMLRDGAAGETKIQIDKVIDNREINNVKVKDRINVANAAFIPIKNKDYVSATYYQKLKDKYKADILYDEYRTYKPVNDWIRKETNGMINGIADDNEVPGFDIAIANAVAIDVDWYSEFDCSATSSMEFTKQDNTKYNVAMMHKIYKYAIQYFDIDGAKGIVLPYKSYNNNGHEVDQNGNNLEFVGILPDGDIKTYINNINSKTFTDINKNIKDISNELQLSLDLPIFKYEYDYKDFKESLINLGIKDVFDPSKSDLINMLACNGYVSKAIHKTHIDLNEKGTKAAAVTEFEMEKTGMAPREKQPETIKIEFNKPFAYMIRDHKTKEILFFGVVYEPVKWTGSTCK